jgi:predicted permease
MRVLRRFLIRLAASAARRRDEKRLREELEQHLALQTAENVRSGLSPSQARRQAVLKLGAVEVIKEHYRDEQGLPVLDNLLQDVRYTLRQLHKAPVFAAAAILTLGLGIGANAALFTVTRAVLFKTLPVERPDQLVEIGCINPRNPEDACRTHYPGFLLLRGSTELLSGMFAWAPIDELAMNVDGRAEIVTGLMLSGNAYSVLGMSPFAGRLLTATDDEPGAPMVAVLSHQFWQRRFLADPAIVGRTLHLGNQVLTIVGVTPPTFRGLTVGIAPDVTLPIRTADVFRRPGSLQARSAWWVYVMGRLKPGVTAEQAQAELDPIFHQTLRMTIEAVPANVAAGLKDFVGGIKFRISPAATGGISDFRQVLEQPVRILWGVVALVLLITCANLAGLLLSRAMDRRREFGVRLALGAGRARLARQVFTEALVLTLAGGVVGLVIARWAAPAGLALGAGETGLRAVDLRPDTAVLAFITLVSIGTGLAIGLGSVWRTTRTDPAEAWRAPLGHGARAPLARTLIVGQLALAMVLLIAAILFVRSFANARDVDPGFDSEHLITLTVAPSMAGYRPDAAMGYLRRVIAATEALPGITSATYNAVPIATGLVSQTSVSVPGFVGPADQMVTGRNRVGPRFVETLGLRLIAGRDFRPGDDASSPRVAIVNERFARHFFQNADVLGRTFLIGGQEHLVVGVVADAHDRSVVRPTENWIYVPFTPDPVPRVRVTIRTSDGVLPVATALEKTLQAVDPAVPVYGVRSVSVEIAETLRRERLLATLGTAFGALAVGLVAIGIYALFSGMVTRRTREIGIRMAVGAEASHIALLLAREASVLALSGLGVGFVAATAAASIIRSQLFNVEPTDARSFVVAAAVLLVATTIAVWIPAWRAIGIQPAETLRAN